MVAGVALGLIAVFMVNVYISQQRVIDRKRIQEEIANSQANQASVLVAKEDIARGVPIEASMLDVAIVPTKYIQPQAVTSLDRVAGMTTITTISKGEQITLNKLITSKDAGGESLAMATPLGKRAITISVDGINAVGGMIKPGDYVDVTAMIPMPFMNQQGQQSAQPVGMPLFQNVLILAIGHETVSAGGQGESSRYKKEEKKEVSPLVTLALTPQEANLISFVQEQSKIRLTLRSPADAQIVPVQPASWETLLQYMNLVPKADEADKSGNQGKPESETGSYVDIYRGLNKERVPLH